MRCTKAKTPFALSLSKGGQPRTCNHRLAGGSPAADYFSCSAKKSNQKKAAPAEPVLRTSLRCSRDRAAATQGDFLRGAQLALTAARQGLRQSSPTTPGRAALLGGSEGGGVGEVQVGVSSRTLRHFMSRNRALSPCHVSTHHSKSICFKAAVLLVRLILLGL